MTPRGASTGRSYWSAPTCSYLAGHLLFKQRIYAALNVPRLVTVGVLLLALPAAAFLLPLVGLAGLVLLLCVLIGVETRRYAALRAGVRPG